MCTGRVVPLGTVELPLNDRIVYCALSKALIRDSELIKLAENEDRTVERFCKELVTKLLRHACNPSAEQPSASDVLREVIVAGLIDHLLRSVSQRLHDVSIEDADDEQELMKSLGLPERFGARQEGDGAGGKRHKKRRPAAHRRRRSCVHHSKDEHVTVEEDSFVQEGDEPKGDGSVGEYPPTSMAADNLNEQCLSYVRYKSWNEEFGCQLSEEGQRTTCELLDAIRQQESSLPFSLDILDGIVTRIVEEYPDFIVSGSATWEEIWTKHCAFTFTKFFESTISARDLPAEEAVEHSNSNGLDNSDNEDGPEERAIEKTSAFDEEQAEWEERVEEESAALTVDDLEETRKRRLRKAHRRLTKMGFVLGESKDLKNGQSAPAYATVKHGYVIGDAAAANEHGDSSPVVGTLLTDSDQKPCTLCKRPSPRFRFDPLLDCALLAHRSMMKRSLKRYWSQRYRLFTRFDEGVLMDEEGWYSVTPERISEHIAARCKCDVVLDAFCGVGGNSIQFANYCRHVIAVDIDPVKIKCARRNAEIYGVLDKIDFVCADFFTLVPCHGVDVVFLSPPWGGPNYIKQDVFDVNDLMGVGLKKIFDFARQFTSNVAAFLPRNSAVTQLTELASNGEYVELEQNVLNSQLKTVTAYFGELVCDLFNPDYE